MLSDYTPITTLATADLARGRGFYEGTLGFTAQREGGGGIFYGAGGGTVFVYESQFAGTNKATAATFEVPEDAFDAQVGALRDKGVTFMTFEVEGIEWSADGIASMGESMRTVWFADPDGNILNVSAGQF